jgi:lipoate synthase
VIRIKISTDPEASSTKRILGRYKLASVYEAAASPNLGEYFSAGSATELGFKSVASAPLVGSACHADKQVFEFVNNAE